MRNLLILLAASTSLAACATQGAGPTAIAEQTAMVSEAAAGPVAPATADKPQIGTFGFDEAGMDRNASPGTDFYSYANGTWQRTTEIPADRSSFGMFHVLDDLSTARSREILDEAAKASGSKIGDFYVSFMDEAAADARGAEPIMPILASIKAAKTRSALAGLMGKLQREGVHSPFAADVRQDDRAPETYIIRLRQSGLGLPNRDYYLKKDPKLEAMRPQYVAYLAQLLTLAGEPGAAPRAAAVMAFETRLAEVQWSQIENRDRDKTYNKWLATDFTAKAPGFDWNAFLAATGATGQKAYLVSQPSAFSGEAKVYAATPVAVIRDYLLTQTISSFAPYLSKPFVDANFGFYGTVLAGTPENEPRWKRGVGLVSLGMGEAVGEVYVARYFPPEAKAAADKLVHNIIAAMDNRLANLAWMAPETKAKARAKLAAFTPKIGYPDKWRDYSTLEIKRDDLIGNVVRARVFEYQRDLNKLGGPIDRGEWGMTPMTINAYANPTLDEIVFPAAILQPPFFDPKADPAVNYGGIGAVIGHETSHHFDDQGRKYDATGKLTDWWTSADIERFKPLTEQLVKQYDAYEPLPGQHVQGGLTLGENIADLAGLTIAYDAYRLSLGGKPAPVIDGFSGDQRFYLGWAQVWRTKYREPQLLQQLLSDPHSPGQQRSWVVRNLDPWYDAFEPKPGETLYLTPEQRVRIW